jgi:amino acid transporter
MHRIQTFSLIVFIVGFFVWLIVPIARSPTHATGKEVFTGELNVTGWSTFVAFMIGTAGVSAAYGAPDSITHLAEETPRPDKDLPRMMVLTPIVSILTGTAMVLTFLFCGVSQLTLVVGGSAPFIPFLQATVRNTAGVTVLSVILIYVQFMACLECQMAVSVVLLCEASLTLADTNSRRVPSSHLLARGARSCPHTSGRSAGASRFRSGPFCSTLSSAPP